MDDQAWLSSAWGRHADTPELVWEEALARVATAPVESAAGLANLVFHVGGEHLGRFGRVVDVIGDLLSRVEDPAAAAPLHRILAAGELCQGNEDGASGHLSRAAGDPAVNRGQVLGLTASALAAQGQTGVAETHLESLVKLASEVGGLDRSLAVTANNLAAGLEQRASRGPEEDALMLRAAQIARVHWEKAGTWLQVERAEYRIAMTRLARGEAGLAAEHAERVLAIVAANGGDPGEAFFGWEALARARRAGGDATGAREARDRAAACVPDVADAGFRAFCVGALEGLDRSAG